MKHQNQQPAISIKDLKKFYSHADAAAIDGISFDIYPGERVGLIGANGSGKTTLFRLILHLLHPDAGEIKIMGNTHLEKAKKFIGYVSEYQEGLENFTPNEILEYAGRMALLSSEKIESRRKELLKWARLESHADQLLAGFSKGMRQRLFLATALIHQPEILLLDEPMSGLDPESQNEFLTLLKSLDTYTILYASHQLGEVEEICQRIIILHQGKIVKDLSIKEQEVEIFQLEADPAILSILLHFPEITIRNQIQRKDHLHLELIARPAQFQDILTESKKQGISIYRIKSKSFIEDLYHRNFSESK